MDSSIVMTPLSISAQSIRHLMREVGAFRYTLSEFMQYKSSEVRQSIKLIYANIDDSELLELLSSNPTKYDQDFSIFLLADPLRFLIVDNNHGCTYHELAFLHVNLRVSSEMILEYVREESTYSEFEYEEFASEYASSVMWHMANDIDGNDGYDIDAKNI